MTANRTVVVRLQAHVSDFTAAMGRAGNNVRSLRNELNQATDTRQGRRNLNELGDAAGRMGLALGAAVGVVVAAAAKFDKQMSAVESVTNATAAEMGQLREAALAAGAATAFSATQAAEAEENLAKAGISVADILGGALAGSLALAAAGSLDLAEAADVSAKAMNMFKLHGGDVGHIADVLAASANKSATDVHEMGEALKMGGMVAANAGLKLEDTVGTLSAFADRALVGSDAGTSLKVMLMMLSNPTEKATNLMEKLGISAYDAEGNFVGVTDLADQLQKKLGVLTQQERNAALATIFGSDATRAATVLYDLGAKGIQGYIDAVDDSGAASLTAATKMDNLAGDLERLKGSLETMAIEAGSGANVGLRQLVQVADNAATSIGLIPAPAQSAMTVIAGVGAVSLLAGAGLVRAREASQRATESLSGMGPTGERASRGLGKVTAAAGKFGAALIAVQAFSAVWGAIASDPSADAMQVPRLAKDLEEFANSGKVAGEAARIFGDDLGLLQQAMYDLLDTGHWSDFIRGTGGMLEGLTGIGQTYEKSLLHSQQRLQALDAALAQLVTSGRSKEAADAFGKLAEKGKEVGVSVNELMKGLPQYAAAVDGARKAELQKIETSEKNILQNRMMAGSLEAAVDAAGDLKKAWEALNSTLVGSLEAQIAVEQSLDDMAESLQKNGRNFDLNTKAGRDNESALIDVAEAAAEAAQKRFEETGSLEQAKAAYDGYIARLRQTMLAAGMTAGEVDRLLGQVARMPPLVQTKVETPGLQAANDAVYSFKYNLATIDRDISVRIHANADAVSSGTYYHGFRWGGVTAPTYARTGLLQAATYRAGNAPLYGFAEPATGGEAFVPRRGNYGRSMSILQTAAGWYGARVTPAGSAGMDAGTVADAIAARLVPAINGLAGLASRPVSVAVDGREIARANETGQRSRDRR